MQLFYNLSDPAMEDMLYEGESMRRFADITINMVPDESRIQRLPGFSLLNLGAVH